MPCFSSWQLQVFFSYTGHAAVSLALSLLQAYFRSVLQVFRSSMQSSYHQQTFTQPQMGFKAFTHPCLLEASHNAQSAALKLIFGQNIITIFWRDFCVIQSPDLASHCFISLCWLKDVWDVYFRASFNLSSSVCISWIWSLISGSSPSTHKPCFRLSKMYKNRYLNTTHVLSKHLYK